MFQLLFSSTGRLRSSRGCSFSTSGFLEWMFWDFASDTFLGGVCLLLLKTACKPLLIFAGNGSCKNVRGKKWRIVILQSCFYVKRRPQIFEIHENERAFLTPCKQALCGEVDRNGFILFIKL